MDPVCGLEDMLQLMPAVVDYWWRCGMWGRGLIPCVAPRCPRGETGILLGGLLHHGADVQVCDGVEAGELLTLKERAISSEAWIQAE